MLWSLLALLLCPPAWAGVVDRIVVVVEDELVLQSDIQLEQLIASRDPSPSPFWADTHGTPASRLTDAALVRAMAGGVSLYQPNDDALHARVAHFRGTFDTPEAWSSFLAVWGLDEDAMRRILLRRMVVESYLFRNLPDDPSDTQAWLVACHALLDQVRRRYRVRVVPLRGEP